MQVTFSDQPRSYLDDFFVRVGQVQAECGGGVTQSLKVIRKVEKLAVECPRIIKDRISSLEAEVINVYGRMSFSNDFPINIAKAIHKAFLEIGVLPECN